MSEIIKLAVVDDNVVYRKDLVQDLQKVKDLDVVNQSSHGEELIKAIPNLILDVILLDLVMPVMDGIQTLDFLKANNPDIKTLVLTVHYESEISLRLIEKGAKGFVFKTEGITEIINAIYMVANGAHRFGDWDLSHIVQSPKNKKSTSQLAKHGCTDRELEVIRFYCQGYSFKEIGVKLFISDRTAETHIKNAMKKVSISNSTRFINYCKDSGLINFKNG